MNRCGEAAFCLSPITASRKDLALTGQVLSVGQRRCALQRRRMRAFSLVRQQTYIAVMGSDRQIIGFAGWNGSGKTTLVTNLLPVLTGWALRVSTIKHAHHDFEVDYPGKDSHRHRQAGATETVVSSSNRWALIHELRGQPELSLDELVIRTGPVDLLLVEGFKHQSHSKIEVFRPALGYPLLAAEDPAIVAIASDGPVHGTDRPILDLNAVEEIATFICDHCGLQPIRGDT